MPILVQFCLKQTKKNLQHLNSSTILNKIPLNVLGLEHLFLMIES